MSAQTWTNILLGLLAASIPLAALIRSWRANKTQARLDMAKVELERDGTLAVASELASKLYAGIIGELRTEITRLKAGNQELEQEVTQLRASNSELRAEVGRLGFEVARIRDGRSN